MIGITDWILAPFVAGYLAGLISGILMFIKFHHRTRGMSDIPSTNTQDNGKPATASVPPARATVTNDVR